MKMRVALGAAALLSALVVAAPASAADWHWGPGVLTWYSPTDGDCIWYQVGATCSGWNFWDHEHVYRGSGGRVLAGFQNNNTIRGRWMDAYDFAYILPSDFAMGGYLIAHVTYWSGADAYGEAFAYQ